MSNALFTAFKAVQLGDAAVTTITTVNFESDTIKVVLYDSADDTFDTTGVVDKSLADSAAGGRVATATLASKTVVSASSVSTFDAADTTFSAVSGDQSELLIIYKDTGTENTSTLVVYFDTFTSGMPVTPNGGDIVITWNASGIFAW